MKGPALVVPSKYVFTSQRLSFSEEGTKSKFSQAQNEWLFISSKCVFQYVTMIQMSMSLQQKKD